MAFTAEFHPQPCAEFPNDNSTLHDGVVWMALAPGGPIRAIRRAPLPPPVEAFVTTPEVVALVETPSPEPLAVVEPIALAEAAAPMIEAEANVVALAPPGETGGTVVSVPEAAVDPVETPFRRPPRFGKVPILVPPRPDRRPALVHLKPKSVPSASVAEPSLAVTEPAPESGAVAAAPLAGAPEETSADDVELPVTAIEAPRAPHSLHEPTPIPPSVLAAPPGPKEDIVVALFPASVGATPPQPLEGGELAAADDSVASAEQMLTCEASPEASDIAAESSGEPPDSREIVPESVDGSSEPRDASSRPTTVAPEPDAFDALVTAMVGVALASGSTRAAATLPKFLHDGRADAQGMDASIVDRLARDRVAELSGSQLIATESLRTTACAWRDVLRGHSEDLSACGATTLDEWASGLLEAFGVVLSSGEIRRALRKRGVAAFGVRIAA